MSESKPTHVVIPKAAFRHFDVIADLALRHGGLEAMQHVQAFTGAMKDHTPEMPKALKDALTRRGAELVDIVGAKPPEEATGTEG